MMAGTPRAVSSLMVLAPARQITRSAARMSVPMSWMYSRTSSPGAFSKSAPAWARYVPICRQPTVPAPWMWWNGTPSPASRARNSAICRFITAAPRLPQKETITGRPSSRPSLALASPRVQAKKSPRTGVPVTSTFSGCL